jgi:hypothetical protein
MARDESTDDAPRADAAGSKSGYPTTLNATSRTIALPVPGMPPFGADGEGSPSRGNVMRLASVIIKLKPGQNLGEFLAARNLCVSFLRRESGP